MSAGVCAQGEGRNGGGEGGGKGKRSGDGGRPRTGVAGGRDEEEVGIGVREAWVKKLIDERSVGRHKLGAPDEQS